MATRIDLSIYMDDGATKENLVAAIKDAASRAAGQIEQSLIPYPLEVNDTIQLGSDVPGVEEVELTSQGHGW